MDVTGRRHEGEENRNLQPAAPLQEVAERPLMPHPRAVSRSLEQRVAPVRDRAHLPAGLGRGDIPDLLDDFQHAARTAAAVMREALAPARDSPITWV